MTQGFVARAAKLDMITIDHSEIASFDARVCNICSLTKAYSVDHVGNDPFKDAITIASSSPNHARFVWSTKYTSKILCMPSRPRHPKHQSELSSHTLHHRPAKAVLVVNAEARAIIFD